MTNLARYLAGCLAGLVLLSGTMLLARSSEFILGNVRFQRQITPNYQATPLNVASNVKIEIPAYDAADESTAFHCQTNHRPGVQDPISCIYAEIDDDQGGNGGAAFTIHQRGSGSAVRVISSGNTNPTTSFGFEAAMFGGDKGGGVSKSETGYLASFQGSQALGESVIDQTNTSGFVCRVHEDAVDPFASGAWTQAYGCFFTHNAINNAFVSKKSAFAASDIAFFELQDSNARPLWSVMDDGDVILTGGEADAGDTEVDSPDLHLRGHWWNGAAEVESQARLVVHIDTITQDPELYFYTGDVGSESLQAVLTDGSLNLQTNAITYAGDITQDDQTVGATAHGPLHTFRGNNWSDPNNYQTDANMQLISGNNPLLRIKVDDTCAAGNGTLISVVDIKDDAIHPTNDGAVSLGSYSRGWGVMRSTGSQLQAPGAPWTCDNHGSGTFLYVDDTNDSGPGYFCACLAISDDGAGTPNAWDYRRMDNHAVACANM